MYPRFTRFECKLFLTDAIRYFDGSCERCMIDNTHVVVLSGTGRDMVPSPEMAAFAERFSFEFRAHAVGDANRSAHVERTFDYVENNFLAGRTFVDWNDLNTQAHAWCDVPVSQWTPGGPVAERASCASEVPDGTTAQQAGVEADRSGVATFRAKEGRVCAPARPESEDVRVLVLVTEGGVSGTVGGAEASTGARLDGTRGARREGGR